MAAKIVQSQKFVRLCVQHFFFRCQQNIFASNLRKHTEAHKSGTLRKILVIQSRNLLERFQDQTDWVIQFHCHFQKFDPFIVMSDFVRIRKYHSAAEAEHMCSVLQSFQIDAFVDGANSSNTLSHAVIALGCGLFVRKQDESSAIEIVTAHEREGAEAKEPWYCSQCRYEVDAEFDFCWQCNADRSTSQVRRAPESSGACEEASEHVGLLDLANAVSAPEGDNPYEPPIQASSPIENEPDVATVDPRAEDLVRRAWIATIFGIAFLPILAHIYSMVLLYRASRITSEFTPKSNKRFFYAIFLNVAIPAGWLAFSIRFEYIAIS